MNVLRVVCLGDYTKYYSYFLYGAMEGTIRCGHLFRPISIFDTDRGLIEAQIDFFKPNILLTHCIFNTKPEDFRNWIFKLLSDVRRKYGTMVFYHMGDAREKPRYPQDISSIVDCGLVNQTNLEHWSSIWKVPCIHWPYACLYQKEIADVEDRFRHDIVFTGGLAKELCHHHSQRSDFVEKLKVSGLDVKVYPDDVIGNSRFFTPAISSSAKAVLGFQMGEDRPGYVDVRPYQYIGAGALFFQNRHQNIDSVFQDGTHYVGFDGSIEDFKYQFKKYALTEFGNSIRQQGFMFCQTYHSYKQRMEDVIDFYKRS